MLPSFFLLLLIEAIGLVPDRLIFPLLGIFLACFCGIQLLLKPQPLRLPKTLFRLVLYLGLSLLVATFFSLNLERSLPNLGLFLGGLIIMAYGYKEREKLNRDLPKWLALTAVFLVLYSLFLPTLPKSGYNLVYSTFPYHNHLGDYLAVVMAMFLVNFTAINLLPIISALPFFLLAHSRSAYLAVLVVGLLLLKRVKQGKILFWGILVLGGVALVLSTQETAAFLPKVGLFHPRSLFQARAMYWSQALLAIKHFPLTGVGLGNFVYASLRFGAVAAQWTAESTNFFLNVLGETGLVSGLLLVILLVWVMRAADKNKPLFYAWLALFIMFQTDYLHSFPSLFLLFFLLAGTVLPKLPEVEVNRKLLSGILAGFVAFLIFLNLHYFLIYMNKYFEARKIYPFNHQVYSVLITRAFWAGNNAEALKLTRELEKRFPADVPILTEVASYYLRLNRPRLALGALKQALVWHPFEYGLRDRIRSF